MTRRTKEQWNVRLKPKTKRAVTKLSDALGFSREDVTEIAFAALFDAKDELTMAKRNMAKRAIEQLKLSVAADPSFNVPESQLTGLAA